MYNLNMFLCVYYLITNNSKYYKNEGQHKARARQTSRQGEDHELHRVPTLNGHADYHQKQDATILPNMRILDIP